MNITERIRHVLKAEAQAIDSIEVTPAFEQTVNLLLSCQSKVLTTAPVWIKQD